MILERHYDDEALIAIMGGGEEAVARDTHLAGCTQCSENLEAYRTMSGILADKSVWDFSDAFDEGSEQGARSIREFAEKMEREDADAAALVDELVSLPRQWWSTTIEADERYGRLAVARRLVEVSEAKIDTMPADAVEFARLAVQLAGMFEENVGALQVRGAAYRQFGYALFYTGAFDGALDAVEKGQVVLERHPSAAYDLARLDIVRSLIYAEQKRHDEALKVARRAADVFRAYGDTHRLISAQMSEGYLYTDMHQFRAALDIFVGLRNRFAQDMNGDELARVHANIGHCQSYLGSVNDALQSLQLAADMFAEAGNEPEAVRVNYNIGSLLTAQGQHVEAKNRFKGAQAAFARLGMIHQSVVVGLDLAEIALLENNFEEVEELCRAAMRKFEAAGVAYSREALTALTFLREAAEQRRATQATVWHVKTYIRRLPEQPALLFAPAPLPPT